jgi:hypothetical protein
MSAFIVSHAHIDALLNFALCSDTRWATDADELTKDGRKLMVANIESVCARYREKPEKYAAEADYTFHFPKGPRLTPVEVLKACECFDYQACEVEGYDRSPAHHYIACIRGMAMSQLPGWQSAAWEITADEKAA